MPIYLDFALQIIYYNNTYALFLKDKFAKQSWKSTKQILIGYVRNKQKIRNRESKHKQTNALYCSCIRVVGYVVLTRHWVVK